MLPQANKLPIDLDNQDYLNKRNSQGDSIFIAAVIHEGVGLIAALEQLIQKHHCDAARPDSQKFQHRFREGDGGVRSALHAAINSYREDVVMYLLGPQHGDEHLKQLLGSTGSVPGHTPLEEAQSRLGQLTPSTEHLQDRLRLKSIMCRLQPGIKGHEDDPELGEICASPSASHILQFCLQAMLVLPAQGLASIY